MKVLVTGGAGFIGSAYCRYLMAETDAEIVNLDKLTYASSPEALAGLEGEGRYAFERADICDAEALGRVFAEHRPDAVVHLAAETHVDRSIDSAADFVQANIVGTFTLLEAVRRYWSTLDGDRREAFRFHHVSTDEVFGALGESGRFTEATPYAPTSPYSASKASADHLVRAWHHTYGLPVLVSNCSNNYGPFQFPEKLIPLTILNALEERPLPVYGRGLNVRDWLHVEDHARALWLILRTGRVGRTYNVGGGAERANIDVVRMICSALDERRPRGGGRRHADLIAFVDDRPGHDFRYAIDPTRIREELGWRPRTSFEEGLAMTVDWYMSNEAWWRPLRERVYDGQRLGLGAGGARGR